MDLLTFINHFQKRVRKGGRVHGVGQGHNTAITNATAPGIDRPDDAAIGYLNADMVDGYHAKQTYQGIAPTNLDGLNADTLDGTHKGLGHVSTASDFNTAPTQKATTSLSFTGLPKAGDQIKLELYLKGGANVYKTLTYTALAGDEASLAALGNNLAGAISGAGGWPLEGFTGASVNATSGALALTAGEAGPKRNLDVLVVTITPVAGSTLATTETGGVYRFAGGGPDEGLNADKLDDYHGREHYHKTETVASQVVKEPPPARGLNADTLDSFHAREAYHGIYPDTGTGLNADTLDGVHKLQGPKIASSATPEQLAANYGTVNLILGSAGIHPGAQGAKLKIEVFDVRNRSLGSVEKTSTTTDVADELGQLMDTELAQVNVGGIHDYIWATYNPVGNHLVITSKKLGERNQYTVEVTVTDPSVYFLAVKVDGETDDKFVKVLRVGLKPPYENDILGVDADMLDGVHKNSGHFGKSVAVEGQDLSEGIHADLLDGLHARTAATGNTVQSETNADGTVKTDNPAKPYLPVADGKNGNHTPKNPNMDADTVDGYEATEIRDAALPQAGTGIVVDNHTDGIARKVSVSFPVAQTPQQGNNGDASTAARSNHMHTKSEISDLGAVVSAGTGDGGNSASYAVTAANEKLKAGAADSATTATRAGRLDRDSNHYIASGAYIKTQYAVDGGNLYVGLRTSSLVRFGPSFLDDNTLYVIRTSDVPDHTLHQVVTVEAAFTATGAGRINFSTDPGMTKDAGITTPALGGGIGAVCWDVSNVDGPNAGVNREFTVGGAGVILGIMLAPKSGKAGIVLQDTGVGEDKSALMDGRRFWTNANSVNGAYVTVFFSK